MRSVWLLAGVGLMCAAGAWAADADPGNRIPAVWKEQHLSFVYVGRTSRYSCDGLRDKVRAILLELGARRDLQVAAIGCEPSAALVPIAYSGPRLTIVASMPALPDAAAKPLHPGDLTPVDARFEAFTIANDPFRNMGMADCELVQEFARQILPKFVTRDLKQDISCIPFAESGSRFVVRGEILRALPRGLRP
ncbi:MAG: hypothetical protein WA803_07115 [Steroidobacteraceae bacterium]